MSTIIGNIPYIKCFARKEYLHDREHGHGEFIDCRAHAVQCERGDSLWFNCFLGPPYGGCHFRLPITALVGKPCSPPEDMTYIQPWDCFGHEFGVVEQDFTKSGAAFVLPAWKPAQYLFTIAFRGTDLVHDPDQHKYLHVVEQADGLIGAFPNNRLIIPDEAFWPTMDRDFECDLKSLDIEARAEGHQQYFDPLVQDRQLTPTVTPILSNADDKEAAS